MTSSLLSFKFTWNYCQNCKYCSKVLQLQLIDMLKGLIMATASIRLDETLVLQAKATGAVESRSAAKQIEYWAKIGKVMAENPDLPYEFVRDALIAQAEAKLGNTEVYSFDE